MVAFQTVSWYTGMIAREEWVCGKEALSLPKTDPLSHILRDLAVGGGREKGFCYLLIIF